MAIQQIDVKNYRALIAKHALATWRRLPPQTKSWISPEDMIEDGIWFIYYSALNPKAPGHYRPESNAKFSTFLYQVLSNFYREYYSEHHYGTQRKRDAKTVAIETLRQSMSSQEEKLIDADIALQYAGANLAVQAPDYDFCHIVDAFVALHKASSLLLQQEIVRWFLQPRTTKFHLHGVRFNQARKEFKQLAPAYDISIEGCRHVLKSPVCLDAISRRILFVPYDLNNPTPMLRGWDTRWLPSII